MQGVGMAGHGRLHEDSGVNERRDTAQVWHVLNLEEVHYDGDVSNSRWREISEWDGEGIVDNGG